MVLEAAAGEDMASAIGDEGYSRWRTAAASARCVSDSLGKCRAECES
ncbi:hypothetical protein AKJ09_03327 [Labilithrix luteola]|uniref:Uncharacterized protein n=1 Tax=Labilithrix luteola TaxID=1391654 RepID=A0A0K1PSZ9_9BACT|nr:hypothetical protein AKJ09_03327 [Labilithrix luteola]